VGRQALTASLCLRMLLGLQAPVFFD